MKKIRGNNLLKLLAIAVISALIICGGLAVKGVTAYANTTSDETINFDTDGITADKVAELIAVLGYDSYEELSTNLTTPVNSDDLTGAKTVTLGGVEFNITYVSKADYTANGTNEGDVIVTLWVAESSVTSEWNTADSNKPTDLFPANMYSSSLIRSTLVGSDYLAEKSATSLEGTGEINNAWEPFNEGGELYNYLATPANMAWQESLSAENILSASVNYPNEAWGTLGSGSFATGYDYSSKDGYADWQNDRIWLPALSEAAENGLWNTNQTQRCNASSFTWLRSGSDGVDYSADCVFALRGNNGNSINNPVIYSRAVRPAVHLNLKTVVDEVTKPATCEFPSGWKHSVIVIGKFSNITEITFAKTAPVGYTDSGKTLNTYIKIYAREDDADNQKIAFVFDGTITAPQNCYELFDNLVSVKSINLDNFSTEGVTNMGSMFEGCNTLTALDVTSFVTSEVTDMQYMFFGCNSLTTLDLSNFATANVTDMSYMFYSCINLTTLDLSSFDTENVKKMRCMFDNCNSLLKLDLSSFNTENVTDANFMFDRCNSLNEIKTPKKIVTELPLPCNYWNSDTERGLINKITSADASSADAIKTIYRHADHVELTAATCEVKAVCSICGQNYGEFAAHTLTPIGQTDKTCTADGVLAHDYCSVCEKNFIEGVEKSVQELKIPAGHELASVAQVEKTCTADGVFAHNYCSVCEKNFIAGVEKTAQEMKIPAGHELASVAQVEKTCTTDGVLAHDCCSVCEKNFIEGVEKSVQELKIPAGHELTAIAQKDKTCTADGVFAHDYCSVCEKNFIEGVEKTVQEMKIPAGHELTAIAQKDKNCTADGVLAHDYCSVCEKNFIAGVEKSAQELKIPAGHTPAAAVKENEVAATCTQTGSCDEVVYCSVCNEELSRNPVEMPALGHDYADYFTVDTAATCTTAGSKSIHCSRCDSAIQATAIAVLGHDYGEWTVVKEATKEEEGEERRVCANDGTHYESRTLPKLTAPEDNGEGKTSQDKFSAGAIAGITTGVIVFVLLAVYIVSYFALYRREILLKGKFFDAVYAPMNAIFKK